jgi:hypothetical protein
VFCSAPLAAAGGVVAPEVVDEAVGGDDLADPDEQRGEERTLLPAR